jgi:hypothetical protein
MLIDKLKKHLIHFKDWGLLLLIAFVSIPFQQKDVWLNGFPFNTLEESLLLVIILPLLYIFNSDFLKYNVVRWILLIGVVLKISGNMVFPSQGIEAKVFSIAKEGLVHQETYEGIGLKKADFIIINPLKSKNQFPAEWINCQKDKRRDTLSLVLQIEAYIMISNPTILDFSELSGLNKGSYLSLKSKSGIPFSIDLADSHKSYKKTICSGVYKLEGLLIYQGEDWLFDILVNDKGIKKSIIDQGIVYTQNLQKFIPLLTQIGIYFTISLNLLIAHLIVLWLYYTLKMLKIDTLRYLIYAFFLAISILTKHYYGVNLNDLANSIFLYGCIILILSFFQKKRNIKADSFIGFIMVFISFFFYFQDQIQTFKWYTIGDDWQTYQQFARSIFLDADWINWGETSMVYQPLYRFFVGIFHVLFGQSSFAQNMFDVWCILGMAYLVFQILELFKLNPYISSSASVFLVFIMLKPGMNRFVGSGLQEITAAFFLVLCFYFIIKHLHSINSSKYLNYAGLASIIAIWLRVEHLIAIAAFGLFLFPMQFSYRQILKYRDVWHYFSFIFIAISLYLLKIYFHNFIFLQNRNDSTIQNSLHVFAELLIPYNPSGEGFLWFKFIFFSSIIVSFLLILKFFNHKYINLILIPFCLFSTFFPYLFLEVHGYVHRFCIHILPFSLITIAFCVDYCTSKKPLILAE